MEKIGFSVKTLQKEGRPIFESSLFVRLYLYGYLNGLRSSRKLEKECEHALILLVYNIKRSMNILGVPDLIEKLKNFKHPYVKDGCFVFFRINFKHMSALLFFQRKMAFLKTDSGKQALANSREILALFF